MNLANAPQEIKETILNELNYWKILNNDAKTYQDAFLSIEERTKYAFKMYFQGRKDKMSSELYDAIDWIDKNYSVQLTDNLDDKSLILLQKVWVDYLTLPESAKINNKKEKNSFSIKNIFKIR